MKSDEMNEWMKFEGREFLEDIGILKNQFVLDFGCRHGTYSIPAALTVGEKGIVYAIDKEENSLKELETKAKEQELKNIKTMVSSEKNLLPFEDEHIDTALLYDVIHLIKERKVLLNELNRVLKNNGILSIYPRHHKEKMSMSLEELQKEIESEGFHFKEKIYKKLMHDDNLVEDWVLVFQNHKM